MNECQRSFTGFKYFGDGPMGTGNARMRVNLYGREEALNINARKHNRHTHTVRGVCVCVNLLFLLIWLSLFGLVSPARGQT